MILGGCVLPALVLVGLLLIAPPLFNLARGDALNAGVFSTDTKLYGSSYGDWTAKWWQWIFSIPKGSSPTSDTTGSNCGLKQSGPVFYLAGMQGGVAQRACSIPVGKAILFPILNGECTFADTPTAKTDSDLISCARGTDAGPVTLSASIDGRNLQQLDKYRVTSNPFNATMVENNIAGAKAGPTRGASDGWWIFLNPLPAGNHEIHFTSSLGNPTVVSTSPPFAMDVTYHLKVQ